MLRVHTLKISTLSLIPLLFNKTFLIKCDLDIPLSRSRVCGYKSMVEDFLSRTYTKHWVQSSALEKLKIKLKA